MTKCPMGQEVGVYEDALGRIPPGPCEACGRGPLHGPRRGGGGCGCSFIRGEFRLCRLCALLHDLKYRHRASFDVRDVERQVLRDVIAALEGLEALFG